MIEMSHWLARLVVPLALCGLAPWAQAQAVYKCQSQGKTTYSREPCPGVLEAAASRNMQGALTFNAEVARTLVHQAEEQRKKYVALGCSGL